MIRALIATLNGEAVTLEPTTDRELIAKVIRQGGRRIWVDASDSDEAERGWLAALYKVPEAQLSIDYPFFEQTPGLTLCIPVISRAEDTSKTLPILLIARSDDKLLTLHPARVTLLNAAFERAARTPSDWQISMTPLISSIIHAAFDPILSAQAAASQENTALSKQIIETVSSRAVPALLTNLYAWRLRAAELTALTDRPIDAIRKMAQAMPPITDSTSAAQFGALAYRLTATRQMLSDQIAASDTLIALVGSRQTAELTGRVRGIGLMLLIALPLITSSVIALILLPLQTNLVLSLAIVLMIVSVVGALILGKARRWW